MQLFVFQDLISFLITPLRLGLTVLFLTIFIEHRREILRLCLKENVSWTMEK